MADPLVYFLTWHTYGTWLPGHERGSVDDQHNAYGDAFAPPDADKLARSQSSLAHGSVSLDEAQRGAVQAAIVEVCDHRKWLLLALHVRTTHVHAVVTGAAAPEKIMNDFKAYATRRLRREQLVAQDARLWSTHGSTRYLWTHEQVREVLDYVVNRQGVPLQPLPIDNRRLSEPGA